MTLIRATKHLLTLVAACVLSAALPGCGAPPQGGMPPPDALEVPQFPWPPPRATTSSIIAEDVFVGDSTLGAVANRLNRALTKVEYADRRFYSVPGGFALATQLEQIEADGSPKPEPDRWSSKLPRTREFSLERYIYALLSAPEGHYRVLVFIASDQPFAMARAAPTEAEAGDWVDGGLNVLPDSIASRDWTPQHRCTVLVYQFRKKGHGQPSVANPDGAPSAIQHLAKTGLMAAFDEGASQ